LKTEESPVLAMESLTEGGRSWVLISLEDGVFSPNPNAIKRYIYNSPRVHYLEYYYPKYSHDPRSNWDNQILVVQDKVLLRNSGGKN
jgi:hypothetical protein